MNWIESLNMEDLARECPGILLLDKYDIDTIAAAVKGPDNSLFDQLVGDDLDTLFMLPGAPEHPKKAKKSYWKEVKKEFYIFLCTDDPKYKKVKDKLQNEGDKGTKYVVGVIAGVIATSVDIALGGVVTLVALFLGLIAKIGKEAFCKTRT